MPVRTIQDLIHGGVAKAYTLELHPALK
jgi:hypothetical protein